MGCCCSKSGHGEVIEMSVTTNIAVTLKIGQKGENVVVVPSESGYTVTGSGIALASCPLDCDVGMWEVKIGKQPSGVRVGVMRFNTKKAAPSLGGLLGEGVENWYFPDSSHGGKDLEEGDVVSLFWDQTDLPQLSFAINGTLLPQASVSRVRPSSDVYPACSVEPGSSCELIFDGQHFNNPPSGSSKFKMVICATNLI